MTTTERIALDNEADQRTRRLARGLRAVAATLLVVGLVAAVIAELPGARSTVVDSRPTESITAPAAQPLVDHLGAPTGTKGSPEEFQDRMPTPPSVIVG